MAADEEVLEFLRVMRRLRAECPWKAAQTHRSLARYLLEETHETLEALDTGDPVHLREELGDLLLQVFLHAAIAEQAGEFTMADVARDATDKMVRRNPHVFDPDGVDPQSLDPAGVNEAWEAAKAREKRRTSVTDGLPPGPPRAALRRQGARPARPGRFRGRRTAGSDDLGDRLAGPRRRGAGVRHRPGAGAARRRPPVALSPQAQPNSWPAWSQSRIAEKTP